LCCVLRLSQIANVSGVHLNLQVNASRVLCV
jgi:hypothetical protein